MTLPHYRCASGQTGVIIPLQMPPRAFVAGNCRQRSNIYRHPEAEIQDEDDLPIPSRP